MLGCHPQVRQTRRAEGFGEACSALNLALGYAGAIGRIARESAGFIHVDVLATWAVRSIYTAGVLTVLCLGIFLLIGVLALHDLSLIQ